MSFSKKTIQKGSGLYTPTIGSSCKVEIKCDETAYEDIGFQGITVNDISEITLGEWEVNADGVIHSCVQDLVEDEVCEVEIIIDKDNPFGFNISVPCKRQNCEEKRRTITLEVTLCSFTKGKELWEMSLEERFDAAFLHKSRGTDLYKTANKFGAFRRFSFAAKYLISMGKEEDIPVELRTKWKTLCSRVFSNMAACQMYHENHEAVIENCTKALTYDENNVKGYFRRAQARFKLNDLDNAESDLIQAHKLDPANTAVEKLLKDVKSQLNVTNSKMANAMRKMFSS